MTREKSLAIPATLTAIIVGLANLSYLAVNRLHPDEAYYWVWSRKLAWGYFDNSPLIAYVIRFFTNIGGNSEFWVRFPAFLGWIWVIGFSFFFALKIYRKRSVAYLALLIALFVPLLASGSHIMTPDIPLIFFASIVLYYLYRAIEEERKNAWYGAGFFLGLALLAKFQAILLLGSILLMLLLRSTKRRWLHRKEPYLAALISLLMFTPVLYWNWTHQWASFAYQAQHGIHHTFKMVHLGEFLGGQVLVFSLLFIVLIYYAIKRTFQWHDRKSADLFLMYCFMPVFLFFGFTSLTYPALPNWPAIGYLPAIIFLAAQLQRALEGAGKIGRFFIRTVLGISFIVSILLLTLVRYPDIAVSRLHIDLPSKLILTNSTFGYQPLAAQVDKIIVENFGTAKAVPLFGDSYQTAAELQFYVSKPVTVFTTREAHRCQYDYITAAQIGAYDGQGGLLVLSGALPPTASQYFQAITLVEKMAFSRFGNPVRSFNIYRFEKLNASALYQMAVNKPLGYPGTYPAQ